MHRRISLGTLRIGVFLCLICLPSGIFAQTWSRFYRASGSAHLAGSDSTVRQTVNGGYIVWGLEPVTGTSNVYTAIRLNSAGGIVWQKSYKFAVGNQYNGGAIQEVAGGGYIACGTVLTSSTDFAVWVVRLGPVGNIIWQKMYDANYNDQCFSVQQTASGGYVVGGLTGSFGIGSGTGLQDVWVLSLDSLGNVVWQKNYGGPGVFGGAADEQAYSIREVTAGGFIVAGTATLSSGVGTYQFWVVRLDALGSILWQWTYGGSGSGGDFAFSVRETPGGGFIVAGTVTSFGTGSAIWVLNLDANGNIVWQKVYDGPGAEYGYAVQPVLSGGFVVTGSTNSYGAGGDDIVVLRLNSSGNILWQKTYGTPDFESAQSIEETSAGGFILGGERFVQATNTSSIWVLKLDSQGQIKSECLSGTSALTETDTSIIGMATTAVGVSSTAPTSTPNFVAVNTQSKIGTKCP